MTLPFARPDILATLRDLRFTRGTCAVYRRTSGDYEVRAGPRSPAPGEVIVAWRSTSTKSFEGLAATAAAREVGRRLEREGDGVKYE